MSGLDQLLISLAPVEAFAEKGDPNSMAGLIKAREIMADLKIKLAELEARVLSDLNKAGFTFDQIKAFESALELSKCIGFYDCRILFGEIIQSKNPDFLGDSCSKTNQTNK